MRGALYSHYSFRAKFTKRKCLYRKSKGLGLVVDYYTVSRGIMDLSRPNILPRPEALNLD